ncbi:MAG: hypothetical protein MI806_01815 [Minwuiales bacterium]|nr:hypothetical protein [Minwuiales bacterium]
MNAADGVLPSGGALMAGLSTENTLGGLAVSGGQVAAFLGVSLGALEAVGFSNGGDPNSGPAVFGEPGPVGTAMLQTFSAKAGDELSFAFNFGTNESPNTDFNDSVFLFFDGEFRLLADTGSVFPDAGADFEFYTGFKTVSFTIDSTGDHTIGFAILDERDAIVDSILLIDDVVLQSGEDVPAAPGLPLLAMGLAGLVAFRLQSARSNRK